jgi:putative FmdB family regulatory protein
MPIYEYECDKCGFHREVLQRFSDDPIAECEMCHGSMKKLISQSTFHLKGTGWYVTDYASKSGSASGGKKENSSVDEKSSSKAETKNATDSEKKSSDASKADSKSKK